MFIGTVRTTLTIDTEMDFTEDDGVEDIGAAVILAHDLPKNFIGAATNEYRFSSNIKAKRHRVVEITDIVVRDVDIKES